MQIVSLILNSSCASSQLPVKIYVHYCCVYCVVLIFFEELLCHVRDMFIYLENINGGIIVQSLIPHSRVQLHSFAFFTAVDVQVLCFVLQSNIRKCRRPETHSNTGIRSSTFYNSVRVIIQVHHSV